MTSAIHRRGRGFALATVLIVSTVMLTVLVVSVASTAAVRVSLQSQYYNTLTKTAAESGVNFAKACLNSNGGIPQWTNSTPLMPNTDCSGAVQTTCNASATLAACNVNVSGDIASRFSVAAPDVDGNGKATDVPSTGIVNVLRTSIVSGSTNSTTAPWRVYKLTQTASLITPNLCGANSVGTAGWNATYPYSEGDASFADQSATPITINSSSVLGNPGTVYFRKDFSVPVTGTYTMYYYADDRADVYMDGQYLSTSISPSYPSKSITLTAGCHTVIVASTNKYVFSNRTHMEFAIKNSAGRDTVVSDTSWHAIAGNVTDFSSPNYYDSHHFSTTYAGWGPVRLLGQWNATSTYGSNPTNWTGDTDANWISSTVTSAGLNQPYAATYPYASYMAFRGNNGFTLSSADTLSVQFACDDSCSVSMDGTQIATNSSSSTSTTVSVPASAGTHDFGVVLYNAGSTNNASGFVFSATRSSDGATVMRSDGSWEATNLWTSSIQDPVSYDSTYVPSGIPATNCGTTGCANVTNMITNPSFESADPAISNNFNFRNTTYAQSSSFAADGTYSLQVTPSASTTDSSFGPFADASNGLQGFIVNHDYLLTATVKVPSKLTGTLDTAGRIIAMSAYSLSSGGYNVPIFSTATVPNAAGTYNLSLEIYVPSDATQEYLRFYNGDQTGGGSLYWDKLSLVDVTSGPTPASYHIGTTPYYP